MYAFIHRTHVWIEINILVSQKKWGLLFAQHSINVYSTDVEETHYPKITKTTEKLMRVKKRAKNANINWFSFISCNALIAFTHWHRIFITFTVSHYNSPIEIKSYLVIVKFLPHFMEMLFRSTLKITHKNTYSKCYVRVLCVCLSLCHNREPFIVPVQWGWFWVIDRTQFLTSEQ